MRRRERAHGDDHEDVDPLAGIANLFDVSVVFIVGLMVALFSTYRLAELADPNTDVTIVKTDASGAQEILIKKGTTMEKYQRRDEQLGEGKGKRLGTAYRLESGEVIYVPEEASHAPAP